MPDQAFGMCARKAVAFSLESEPERASRHARSYREPLQKREDGLGSAN